MKLTLDKYTVSRETLEAVLEALDNNFFTSNDGESYNNDDIILAHERLQAEVTTQEEERREPEFPRLGIR